jgi:uncharacterized membrane protein YdjX (TVP38/TMEM64 family)
MKNGMFKRFVPIAFIAVGAMVGTYFFQDYLSFDALKAHRAYLLEFKQSNVMLLSVGFVISYVAITAFSLPGAAVASITGGFLFGLPFGTFLNTLAASTGATALFIAVRWGIGDFMLCRLDRLEGRSEKIIHRLRSNELSVLLSLRLIPVVPFFVINLLAALVGMKLRNFVIGTVFGILPGAVVFTWVGVGVGEVFDRGAEPDLSLIWAPNIILPLVGLGLLSILPIFFKTHD